MKAIGNKTRPMDEGFSQTKKVIFMTVSGTMTVSMGMVQRLGSQTGRSIQGSSRTVRRMAMVSTLGPMIATTRARSLMACSRVRARTSSPTCRRPMLVSLRMPTWRASGRRSGKTAGFTQATSRMAGSKGKAP